MSAMDESFDRALDFSRPPETLAGPRDLGPLGAVPDNCGTAFRVWAPRARTLDLVVEGPGPPVRHRMEREKNGYFRTHLAGALPGTTYRYLIDGETLRPDPASRLQREGVHGPSTVWARPEAPTQPFPGHSLQDLFFYELHVGTFSPSSTFEGILPYLDHLARIGVTALELMPVSQFPGARNWGYDGVFPFAVQWSYGGPDGLFRFVREAHRKGLSVFLDVVYNHLGPEGNYLSSFGPYFSETTRTPWGEALNFDGPESDHVRHFFLENLRTLALNFDLDGFRLDAIHAIRDQSPHPFLADISCLAKNIAARRGRPLHLVAESNANDRRTVLPVSEGGLGFDAQWSDDFHHALHVHFTGERDGYYQDFSGTGDLALALSKGFVYRGQPSPAFRCRRGSASEDLPGHSFVFFAQNHDQTGNRRMGDRIATLVSPEALPLITALVVLSPGLPLLFMGEEYGEDRPFLYFTDHGDPDLVRAVREGRKREFASFGWTEEVPDPQDPETFARSRLSLTDPESSLSSFQHRLLDWTARLAKIRRTMPALHLPGPVGGPGNRVMASDDGLLIVLRGDPPASRIVLLANASREPRPLAAPFFPTEWKVGPLALLLDSGPAFGKNPFPLPLAGRTGLTLDPYRTLLLTESGP